MQLAIDDKEAAIRVATSLMRQGASFSYYEEFGTHHIHSNYDDALKLQQQLLQREQVKCREVDISKLPSRD